MSLDDLAELEQQRSFLIRSLRDLDAERRAGDLDEHDYQTLRDDYTRRAAEVLRGIEDGKAALPSPRPRSLAHRIAVGAIVMAVAVVAGWLVARSAGERTPETGSPTDISSMDVATMLSQARSAIERDPDLARRLYEEVLRRDPDHAEARTYSAWLLVTAAMGSDDDALRRDAVDVATERLERVVADEPDYADPYCFLGVIGAVDRPELVGDNLDTCLRLDPPADLARLVEQARANTIDGEGSAGLPTTIA